MIQRNPVELEGMTQQAGRWVGNMSFGVGGQQEGISRCLINLALDPRAAGALAEGIREAEEHSKGNSGTSVRRSILAPATRRVPNTHCIVRVIPAPCAVAGWRRHSQGALHARIKVAQPHDAESSVGDKEIKPLNLLLLLLLRYGERFAQPHDAESPDGEARGPRGLSMSKRDVRRSAKLLTRPRDCASAANCHTHPLVG